MPTKAMKLGFDNKILQDDSLRNIRVNGKTVGFHVGIHLNYYRGLHVSCVEKLELKVDGQALPEEQIIFGINGKKFTLSQLKYLFSESWGVKTMASLEVYDGKGLGEGEHDVELILELRNESMRFGPGEYGTIDGSARKTLTLQKEAIEL